MAWIFEASINFMDLRFIIFLKLTYYFISINDDHVNFKILCGYFSRRARKCADIFKHILKLKKQLTKDVENQSDQSVNWNWQRGLDKLGP